LQGETEWLLELVRVQPGITLAAVRRLLCDRGTNVALSSVWRFYDRHGIRLRQYRGMTQ
jgi:transposase